MNMQKVIDKYEEAREQRTPKIEAFRKGERPFLVCVSSPYTFYNNCNTIEQAFESNIHDFNVALDYPSDTLPFLEPWFGTGTVAEAFGGKYEWGEGRSPACHYAYQTLEEVMDIAKPSLGDGKIFKMVLDAIAFFKEKTAGRLPISVTDTQSAHDNATLILDAVEVFTAGYDDPEALHAFLKKINDVMIEFTKAQIEALGDCHAVPGHIMDVSTPGWKGMALACDNLAVASPQVNGEFLIPHDDEFGEAFGGLAVHSCGKWDHSMPLVAKMKNIMMIDCAISGPEVDPAPNEPEKVRDAFRGTDIITQVRLGPDMDRDAELIKRVWADDLRLIVKVLGDDKIDPQYQYDRANEILENLNG